MAELAAEGYWFEQFEWPPALRNKRWPRCFRELECGYAPVVSEMQNKWLGSRT
jgi:hypothetical protein